MRVADCPNCGHELNTDHIEDEIVRLSYHVGALLVSASMVRVALADEDHEAALPGFLGRVNELSAIAERDVEELQSWGEAYDGEEN